MPFGLNDESRLEGIEKALEFVSVKLGGSGDKDSLRTLKRFSLSSSYEWKVKLSRLGVWP